MQKKETCLQKIKFDQVFSEISRLKYQLKINSHIHYVTTSNA